MNKKLPRIIPSGGYALTIEVCREVSRECIEKVHMIYYALLNKLNREKYEIIAGLSAITIYYDPREDNIGKLNKMIQGVLNKLNEYSGSYEELYKRREWAIPVVYGDDYGPDLYDVAHITGLSKEEIIRIHTSRKYLCYAIGFTPGFIYLGEVNDKLIVPRLEKPRLKVPAGSVGLAGRLTGVYSIESPGGWRIIGRTPLRMFDFTRKDPMPIKPGDYIVFKSITKREYEELQDVFIGDYIG